MRRARAARGTRLGNLSYVAIARRVVRDRLVRRSRPTMDVSLPQPLTRNQAAAQRLQAKWAQPRPPGDKVQSITHIAREAAAADGIDESLPALRAPLV